MEGIRLQKYLSECGVCSRREAEELLVLGRIKVNGKVVSELGTKIQPGYDSVKVGSKIIRRPKGGIVIFHKPRKVVSTRKDPKGRDTVLQFIPKKYQAYNSVGRLDYDTTGLVILTNDGELANRLSHPRYGHERVYHARVRGHVKDKTIRRIERGVRLTDGNVKAKAKILSSNESSTWIEVVVTEGRNRLVRRLMKELRHPVIKLKRVKFGPFSLGKLPLGETKVLTQAQFDAAHKRVYR